MTHVRDDIQEFKNRKLGEIPEGSYIVDSPLVITPDFSNAPDISKSRINDNYGTQTRIGVGQVVTIKKGGTVGNIRIICGEIEIFCSPNLIASLSEL